ncbi:hypothetical protein LCGC14_1067270 [marine sediment metagenome]|uniref:Uncharacterized protein n=1 Tax=marine sediment metagenome TaxID=412755 RepID=A0A0F9N6D7_9ZZZZ
MKKDKNIDQEIRNDLERIFRKFDKELEKYIGKMCPEFNPECSQCRLNLIYNKFKKETYDEMLK